jgi:rRNA processing protein Krr1/Pno1
VQEIEDYLMTPYGPPDRNARILPVPNDCVGLIIGKNGETIRRLHRETGCKIQIAKKEIPNTDVRNVFIEGPAEKYEFAKKQIEEIIAEQIFLKQNFSHLGEVNPFPGPHTPLRIPNKMVGLIIGKNGETVRAIHQKTQCFIFIPKDSRPGEDFRELELSGPPESVEICKREIISMIHLALYGRLPYVNSLFYPFIDPITGLPIIDPGIMASLDPNSRLEENAGQSVNENFENYENFQQNIFENSNTNETTYNVDDYNNPLNYDLYYQSLYQMYPQMSDVSIPITLQYYKKAQDIQGLESNKTTTPYVLFNTGILDPDNHEINTQYDPNYISQHYHVGHSEENKGGDFDYSKIDYDKYIDSMVNSKGRGKRGGDGHHHHRKNHYDKNAVNDNVNAFYESFYQDLENDYVKPQEGVGFTDEVDTGFKEPMLMKPERKKRSRFDQTDQPQ